jgi:hypothetical protein
MQVRKSRKKVVEGESYWNPLSAICDAKLVARTPLDAPPTKEVSGSVRHRHASVLFPDTDAQFIN